MKTENWNLGVKKQKFDTLVENVWNLTFQLTDKHFLKNLVK